MSRKLFALVGIISIMLITSCTRSSSGAQPWMASSQNATLAPVQATLPSKRTPGAPEFTPTPDAPRVLPTLRIDPTQYTVQANDSLGAIAQRYGVSLDALVQANNISDPNLIEPGQALEIPAADPLPPGPSFKIIPDSELVYGPASATFDISAFIQSQKGYLSQYQETVDNRTYDGAGIVKRVALENSVNPRLLLAVLEYRSGWVTQANPPDESKDYPLLYLDTNHKGLYRQLSWAANSLDRGYYQLKAAAISSWVLQDGSVIPINPTINPGTAGVQGFFAPLLRHDEWELAVSEKGLFATFNKMFGYPFNYAIEPLIPDNLKQPVMQLPFEPGDQWSFTGGPHGGWADGSAWAAIDFAPPGTQLGCVQSDAWEVAVADGLITRADLGAVVEDLDGDGVEQTGWTVLYMHVETRDRVKPGTYVHAGDPIGHPSCEGGVSTGTHLHLARRFNGEWIPADGPLPFNLDGWISSGGIGYYNGYLKKDGVTIEAWEGRSPENQISR